MQFRSLLPMCFAMAQGFLWVHPSKTRIRTSTKDKEHVVRRRHHSTFSSRASTITIRRQESEAAAATGALANSTAARTSHTDSAPSMPPESQQQEKRLWSYVHNLSKARQHKHASERSKAVRPILYSFLAFLSDVPLDIAAWEPTLQSPMETSLIQAMRAAGEIGDYRLVLKLLDRVTADRSTVTCFSPRVFGEAIAALSGISTNVSKLKQVWSSAVNYSGDRLSAFELNVMLQALAKRGRIRSAIDLYQTAGIEGDSYTFSTLLTALAGSIVEDQDIANDWIDGQQRLSPCWQYSEAYRILREAPTERINNAVMGNALKLNERAAEVFSQRDNQHHASQHAMELLQFMKERKISPDVVTCSMVLSAFDKGYQWPAAVTLLDAMTRCKSSDEWSLPRPNEYAYASTISACARCQEYEVAIEILGRMKSPTEADVSPNTWVYNAALASCVGGSHHGRSIRVNLALNLLKQMHQEAEEGLDTSPDTVSYNTVLVVLEGSSQEGANDTVDGILKDMEKHGIVRDSLTYHNAIKVLRGDGQSVLNLVETAVADLGSSVSPANAREHAEKGIHLVFQAALSALAAGDDFTLVEALFARMKVLDIRVSTDGMKHLVEALGRSGQADSVLLLLKILSGCKDALHIFEQRHHLGLQGRVQGGMLPPLALKHCSTAISTLLSVSEMDIALDVLSLMREEGLTPDDRSMQAISLAYCRLATESAAEESRIARKRRKAKKTKRTRRMDEISRLSSARARSAVDIASAMKDPNPRLLSTLASTCSAAGLWEDARIILRRLHANALEESLSSSRPMLCAHRTVEYLPALHRSLLKLCASRGNVSAAVAFVDDIQCIGRRLSSADEPAQSLSAFLDESSEKSVEETLTAIVQSLICTGNTQDLGVKGEDWKLLLISASKSGHWKLCLCTLQFLKPFLEALHPNPEGHDRKATRQYEKLARALTAAILCFEMRSQYAWAVRAIDDWIDWSGRRPRTEAVISACRILAARGQGQEVIRLVSRVLQVPTYEDDCGSEVAYEVVVYAGALNALHNRGLYEESDELYIKAFTQNQLPYEVKRDDTLHQFTLDLHGMNVAMASSAVRIALQQQVLPEQWNLSPDSPSFMDETPRESHMVVITGRGVNSAQRLRPILRPEVQRMLLEEFYPPLSTTSIPGNMGALRVSSENVKAWVLHQRQQKGARMLAVADVLKELSSGDRIRRALEHRGPEQDEKHTKNLE